MPVAAPEVVVERSVRAPPALTTARTPPKLDVAIALDRILDETEGEGYSAAADALVKGTRRDDPGVELRDSVEVAIKIAENAATASFSEAQHR